MSSVFITEAASSVVASGEMTSACGVITSLIRSIAAPSFSDQAIAAAMSRQAAAQRRHSTAQSPQSGWWGECCSQTLAHRSQISAQARQSSSVEGDSRLIQRVERAQKSAQSIQSLMQRS